MNENENKDLLGEDKYPADNTAELPDEESDMVSQILSEIFAEQTPSAEGEAVSETSANEAIEAIFKPFEAPAEPEAEAAPAESVTEPEAEAASFEPAEVNAQPEAAFEPVEASAEPIAAFEPFETAAKPEGTPDFGLKSDDTFEFNPYAPKNAAYQPSEPAANSGVNPTYGQPIGGNQYQQGNGGFPTNYGYNNQGYYQSPPKKNGGGKKAAVTIVVICVAVALIALASSFFGNNEKPQVNTTTAPHSAIPTETTQPTTIPPVAATTAPAPTQAESTTVALQTTAPTTAEPTTQVVNSIWVAEKVRPSVVGVLAYQSGELAGEGSGVLMNESEDGKYTYVITCAHVINEPGCEFAILLLDGSSYEAEVVALDERTDIGVLRVEATGLPLAEFGDSASLKVGEPIYAIGNPGGSEYFGSITNGIVASIDRSISATYTMTCIQHNAAINPGNSGGALVNTAGQVIGINSSKIASTEYEGMGFAVPSAIFASVVDSLIKYGYVPNRPELGIKYATVSDYQLYSIIVSIKGLPKGSIIIADIPEGSALSGTDAQVGDLIIAVNGKKMDSSDVLLDLIDTGAVGDTLTLTLCRINDRSYETSTFDVTVTLVENKGSATTTTQEPTLPAQDSFGDFDDFFGGFFGW